MAAPSSKPSSSPTSSRTNPVSRNSELNNPMGRFFSENPFARPSVITNPRALNSPNTPFNSPSDLRRRQSTDRERAASWRDLEDKENGKDPNPKPGRARSPAPSKTTKNFMSPTISAASKINPSPRKKILVERNEPARSSVSSSEAKSLIMEENELKDKMGLHHQKNEEEKDLVNLEPTFKISPRVCSSSSTPLAPLDADPSVAPYDPKTNYLSPRPQFLHYKPNPRIELYRGRESKQLEASLSDTDVTTEETWSDDSQRELEESSSSELEKEEEKELLSPVPASTVTGSAVESVVEAKRLSKAARFFSGSKLVALLLVLALALYSISSTDFSSYHHQALEGFSSQGFQVSDAVTQLAKAKFDGLAQKVEQWLSDTLSYISQKISVREFSHDHDPLSLQYVNLSVLFDDSLVDGNLKFEQREVDSHITALETEVKPVDEGGDQWEPEEDDVSIEEATETGEEAEQLHEEGSAQVVEVGKAENFEAVLEMEDPVTASEQLDQQIETAAVVEIISHVEQEAEQLQEEGSAQVVEVGKAENFEAVLEDPVTAFEQLDQQVETEIVQVSHDVEMEQMEEEIAEISASQTAIQLPDFFIQEEPSSEANTNNGIETEFKEADERHEENTQLEASSIDNAQGPRAADGKFSVEDVPVTSLDLLCICAAAAAAIFLAKRKNNSASDGPAPEQVPAAKKLDTSPISVTVEHHRASQERSVSRNWPTDDLVDLVSQSGPSQTSSFKDMEDCSEAQSQERRPRSNYSLASSDYSPSYSYGSFTTYEKISSKHQGGEEEIVTPVRRSSRIRKQVTTSAS